MSWSEMPGMLDEDFTREAFDVNMISSILGPRVGWSCIWVKRFEVVISMTACWISWSFEEGLTELFSQFMSGQLKFPPRMTSTVFAPSCVSLSRDFFFFFFFFSYCVSFLFL